MSCNALKYELEGYADGQLPADTASAVEAHIDHCPVCRSELAAINSFRNELRGLSRPVMSNTTLQALTRQVAYELSPNTGSPAFRLIGETRQSWTSNWLMPTTVGVFGSLVFGAALLALIMIPADVPRLAITTEPSTDNPVFLAGIDGAPGEAKISPLQFAHSRSDISSESPSLNPDGSLVAMTGAEDRGHANEDEMVVVAEVFGDGLARITDVVEPSQNREKMNKLMAAFKPSRYPAPFVPATLDNRGDVVRVVMKFQSVNVNIDGSESAH